ncbi:Tetraspanin-19 like [Actinidia chinensis var. chinensis]|uniref:Tetraspanin-19 like n=1 Tax=Actinidia chinensis var. chinensis TaxID=1590841 RepID=A0A2R6R6I3_ACTCC|nr:Tetraspanin-19 like [Actinidia chinensis var. chinensis]
MGVIFLLLMAEAVLAADITLNSEWEKDLPEDPTGKLDDIKEFVENNFELCQWYILSFVSAQGFSILLAAVLRGLITKHLATNYDSDEDDDFAAQKFPFLVYPRKPFP